MTASSNLSQRILRGIAIVVLTLISLLVALELGFRVFPQAIPFEACLFSPVLGGGYCDYRYQFDQPMKMAYRYKPGYVYDEPYNPSDPAVIGAQYETCAPPRDDTFQLTFTADENGFLNPSPWQDSYDIVITGDSFAQPHADVFWIDELGEQSGMSILNLGIGSWGTLSQVEAIREFGLDKNPDWVILVYFEGNDFFNAGEYMRRQESGYSWRGYILHNAKPFERLVMPNMIRYWYAKLTGGMPVHEQKCEYPMTVATEVNRFETVFVNDQIRMLGYDHDYLESAPEWDLITDALTAIDQDVTEQGANFLLVYAPSKEHVYWGRIWDETEVNLFIARTVPLKTFQEFDEHYDDQLEMLAEFATENDIQFLDLTEPLRDTMLGGTEVYHYADSHWNSAGDEVVAQAILEYIQSHE